MASGGGETLLKVGALGAAGYLAYRWYTGQSAAPGTIAQVSPGAAPAAGSAPASSGGSAPASSGAPAAAPHYSGPSLDQMYSALLAAAVAGYQGGDTSVTCQGQGVSGFGLVRGRPAPGDGTVTAPIVGRPRPVGGPTGGGAPRIMPVAVSSDPVPQSCKTPMASPYVWNWYLVNRANVGLTTAPDLTVAFPGADYSVPITGAQYWAGVAPVLSKQLGMSGLGIFGATFQRSGLGWYIGRTGGFGDAPPNPNAPDAQTAADFAALQASAAAGGFDTNAGSFNASVPGGPLVFTPASQVFPSSQIVSGVSNSALALGAGVAVLFLGIAAAGGRR